MSTSASHLPPTISSESTPRPHRRWSRSTWFRICLVLLLIGGIGFVRVWSVRRSVWEVMRAGGEVWSSNDGTDLNRFEAKSLLPHLWPRAWMYVRNDTEWFDWLGQDGSVETVRLAGLLRKPAVSDPRCVRQLRRFSRLECLTISGDLIGPEFAELRDLSELRTLAVHNADLHSHLEHINELPQIKTLTLVSPKGPVGGLDELRQHPTLERLVIHTSPDVGKILSQLAGIETIRWMSVRGGSPLAEVVDSLDKFPNLNTLEWHDVVTDDDLLALGRMTKIEVLVLYDLSKASPAGLRELQRMTSLKRLHVPSSPKAEEFLPLLKELLPNCRVE